MFILKPITVAWRMQCSDWSGCVLCLEWRVPPPLQYVMRTVGNHPPNKSRMLLLKEKAVGVRQADQDKIHLPWTTE